MTFLSGKIAAYVTGGLLAVIVGLALALTVTRGTLKSRTEKLATANATLAAESNAHRVTLASLAQCQSTLAEKSAESDARAKAYEQSKAEDAGAVKSADARQAADKGRRDTLKQIVINSPDSGCRAPTAVLDNLKGL